MTWWDYQVPLPENPHVKGASCLPGLLRPCAREPVSSLSAQLQEGIGLHCRGFPKSWTSAEPGRDTESQDTKRKRQCSLLFPFSPLKLDRLIYLWLHIPLGGSDCSIYP